MITMSTGVSFARVPLDELSSKAADIRALGWEEHGRGDPWAVLYRKSFPEGEHHDSNAELRRVMGDYWLEADAMRDLLDK